jgi:predicted ribosome quality control (RQC) complex YloA/Tae2 family protein
MENFFLSAVVREIAYEVQGRNVVRVSLSGSQLLMDLRLPNNRALLASFDSASPALFISNATMRLSDSEASASHPLASLLRKHVTGAQLIELSKEPLDRIVRIGFEKFDAGGDYARSSLVLALTGRSTNAYLNDARDHTLAALSDRGALPPGADSNSANEISTLNGLIDKLDDSITLAELLDKFFGQSTIFSPQLKNEIIARCRNLSPLDAFKSLIDDLVKNDPVPLLYSRLPLEEMGRQIVNLKTDLLLSHIELSQAQGMLRHQFPSLSEAAEQYYRARDLQKALRNEYGSARQLITQNIKKIEAALSAIEKDYARFEEPETLKRFGELIHANLATARISGSKATVIDYYDPGQPEIEIELNDNKSLVQAAADYFARYQKARRALAAIASRKSEVSRNLEPLKDLLRELEDAPSAGNIRRVARQANQLLGRRASLKSSGETSKPSREKSSKSAGRRFRASDGHEVIVGRNDRENDELTFRIAKPQDVWMHAADYPGSHVVIRNPSRGEVPHKVIVEGAELAAFYSQAKREGKAAVHYTLKKFVSKPPKAKAGLVRLSAFKTVMVEPRCDLDRLD